MNIAINDLKQNFSTRHCITRLAEKLIKHYEKSKLDDKKDSKAFEKKLADIQY